jgi:hypothetical protein
MFDLKPPVPTPRIMSPMVKAARAELPFLITLGAADAVKMTCPSRAQIMAAWIVL